MHTLGSIGTAVVLLAAPILCPVRQCSATPPASGPSRTGQGLSRTTAPTAASSGALPTEYLGSPQSTRPAPVLECTSLESGGYCWHVVAYLVMPVLRPWTCGRSSGTPRGLWGRATPAFPATSPSRWGAFHSQPCSSIQLAYNVTHGVKTDKAVSNVGEQVH